MPDFCKPSVHPEKHSLLLALAKSKSEFTIVVTTVVCGEPTK